jgi:DNA-directed RNA polymerase specialized sigma subunit
MKFVPGTSSSRYDVVSIPAIKLDENRKGEQARIMQRGNLSLQSLHARIKERMGWSNIRYKRLHCLEDLIQAMRQNSTATLHGVSIAPEDLQSICDVIALRDEILAGYSRMVVSLARKQVIAHPELTCTVQDYYDEGLSCLIKAIHYYTSLDTLFVTYAYHVVRRGLCKMSSKMGEMSDWDNDTRKLRRIYDAAKQELNRPTTFDEVVEYLELDATQQRKIRSALIEVIHVTDLSCDSDEKGVGPVLDSLAICHPPVLLDPDQREAILMAPLTEFERAVLYKWQMGGDWGWKAEVAREHINPNTGRPFTRMGASVALSSAFRKIQDAYLNRCNLKEAS